VGTRDLSKIEVAGVAIAEAKFDFAGIRKRRRALPVPAIGIRG
jgi:hypothetical protein